jgi:hypothetical protein
MDIFISPHEKEANKIDVEPHNNTANTQIRTPSLLNEGVSRGCRACQNPTLRSHGPSKDHQSRGYGMQNLTVSTLK